MMYNYPFPSFPGFRRPYPYNIPKAVNIHNPNSYIAQNPSNNYSPNNIPKNIPIKKTNTYNSINNHHHHFSKTLNNNYSSKTLNNNFNDVPDINENKNEDVFDFFGIKLAFDDLLIIALLFFLYKEEAKDPYLYISLILLLLG